MNTCYDVFLRVALSHKLFRIYFKIFFYFLLKNIFMNPAPDEDLLPSYSIFYTLSAIFREL